MLKNCWYLLKAILVVYLIFQILIFFWNFDYFLEPTIKLVTGKSNSNSFEDKTCFYFRCVFQKKNAHLILLSICICIICDNILRRDVVLKPCKHAFCFIMHNKRIERTEQKHSNMV